MTILQYIVIFLLDRAKRLLLFYFPAYTDRKINKLTDNFKN
ncbi:MAG: hypothetical protein XD78_1141 [Desulfotomaculum sp. 46_296]|nr:MAG: hypothetical protein XD78_1141 [Desulfotomaculum sp. 46_296]